MVNLRLPGLASKVTIICNMIGLVDMCTVSLDMTGKWKVDKQIMYHHLKELKELLKVMPNSGKGRTLLWKRRNPIFYGFIKNEK